MNKLIYWYHTRGLRFRRTFIAMGVAASLVGASVIVYTLLVPTKVEVRYGTVVRDPVDGHVWEDHTNTIRVDSNKTDKYSVKFVDRLSPEHEQQLAQEKAQAAQSEAEQAKLQGYEKLGIPLSSQELINIQITLQNVDVSGTSVIQGIELSNTLSATKSKLVTYRNQVAAMPVAAELSLFKERILTIFDKYIQACDLYLLAMTEANQSYMEQANVLVNEASALIPGAKSK